MNNSITHGLKRATALAAFAFLMTAFGGTAVAVEPEAALKSKEVKALVANAKTPADHLKLARHFNAMAKKHEEEALEHEELAAEYARNPRLGSSKTPMSPNSAEHCKYFADHCRKAAKEMRAMAAAHESMAKEAEKQ